LSAGTTMHLIKMENRPILKHDLIAVPLFLNLFTRGPQTNSQSGSQKLHIIIFPQNSKLERTVIDYALYLTVFFLN
jgi:hypothetical protein